MNLPNQSKPILRNGITVFASQGISPSDSPACIACHTACSLLPWPLSTACNAACSAVC